MMGSTSFFNFLVVVLCVASFVASEPMEKCQPRNNTYAIGDTAQCDKFHQCSPSGKVTERLCDDGFVFSLNISQCDYPHNVDCSKRPTLQPTFSTDPKCPRMNGFYAFSPKVSCQKFYHCLEGKPYEKTCPEGVIFDDSKGACVHPDLATRADCSATQVLSFTCPNAEKPFSKLRFGNHDRFRNPQDCRKFFICMQDGSPRLGGCPIKTVFNEKTGKCSNPKEVQECVDYYEKNPITQFDEQEEQDIQGDSADVTNANATNAANAANAAHATKASNAAKAKFQG